MYNKHSDSRLTLHTHQCTTTGWLGHGTWESI